MESYLIACHKCTKHAIESVVIKLIRGEIKDMPKAFAPSSAELSTALRDEMEFVKRQIALEADRVAIKDMRKDAVPARLIEGRIADAKAKMAAEGRRFLFEADSFSGMASRRRECPPGSIFVGILCAAYGPVGSVNQPEPAPVADVDLQAMHDEEIAAAEAEQPEPEQEHADVEF